MIYIIFLIFTFMILWFAFYQWQFFMIFSPTYYRCEELGDDFEILSIKTKDAIELEGVVYQPQKSSETLLFFSGKGQDSVDVVQKLALLYPKRRIISFNYRSYGRSEGHVSEKNILEDSLFIAQIIQKNYGDFYLFGYSLGSNIASFVGSKMDSKGVFLVGAFDSIASLAQTKYKINMSRFLRYKFDTVKYVQKIDAKTYLFVSKDDEVVYIDNARKLKNSIKNLEFYKEFENLTHKELLWHVEIVDKINEVLG